MIASEVARHQIDENTDFLDVLGQLGLLQVTYDIGEEEQAGRPFDPEYWAVKVSRRVRKRLTKAAACFSAQKVSGERKDVGMTTYEESVNHPETPPSTLPLKPRSHPSTGTQRTTLQVSMLEDRIEATNLEMKEKLREIESQVFADECLLTELKWRDAALKDVECKVRADKKRAYRKNP